MDDEKIKALVEQQADDDGCWFIPQTCAEDYLQQRLRELHAAIEARRDDKGDDLRRIAEIANIPPTDDRYGSLAVRMEKVWLIARGYEDAKTKVLKFFSSMISERDRR